MKGPERRSEPRIDTDLGGVISQGSEKICRVSNLSKNGALALSSEPISEHTEVAIRLEVEDPTTCLKRQFSCEAAVVRCEQRDDGLYDIGLFFTRVPPADRAILEEILRNFVLTGS